MIPLLLLLLAGPAHACTSFCFDTPDGPIFGANLDLFIPGEGLVFVNRRGVAKEGFTAGTTGEIARWVSEYGSVTFNVAGREFAWGGMNEAGLVVGGMELRAGSYPEADERPPVTNGTWVQYVLDTCADVEEALRVDERVRPEDSVPPNHYFVADASGRCASIEWLDGEFTARTGDDLPVKAMANMRYDRAAEAFARGGPRWWWSNPGASAERVAGAELRGRSFDADRDTCAACYALETLVHVVAAPHTKWSVVYDVAAREIRYRTDRSTSIKRIAFEALDFSCDAPVLMLDVNAALEGDVTGALAPYDHLVNLHCFRTLCARFGIDLSAEAAERLVRFLEEFPCAPGGDS